LQEIHPSAALFCVRRIQNVGRMWGTQLVIRVSYLAQRRAWTEARMHVVRNELRASEITCFDLWRALEIVKFSYCYAGSFTIPSVCNFSFVAHLLLQIRFRTLGATLSTALHG
jgi:hypothetical protein